MKRLVLFALAILPAFPQVAKEANTQYQTQQGRSGIAKSLSAPDRDHRQKPKELVESLQLQPGMTVADIGTGVGYLLPYLSAAVGEGGKVIAEDIFSDFLDQARGVAKEKGLNNVSFVLGTERDSKLPEKSVDVVLVLDAYHHFDYPAEMLASFRQALKPAGKLVIVDFYKREGAMGPGPRALTHIRIDQADVIKEVEANGFNSVSVREHIPNSQYVALFEPK